MERASKVKQIVRECFVKVAHVILLARVRLSVNLGDLKKNKWFNLALPEVPLIKEQVLQWAGGDTPDYQARPLVISIVHDVSGKVEDEVLLEQWRLAYTKGFHTGPHTETGALYKRAVIFIRSLYTHVRTLPVYTRISKMEQRLRIRYEFSDNPGLPDFSQVPHAEFRFAPIETPLGQLDLSVVYRQTTGPGALPTQGDGVPFTPGVVILDYVPRDTVNSASGATLVDPERAPGRSGSANDNHSGDAAGKGGTGRRLSDPVTGTSSPAARGGGGTPGGTGTPVRPVGSDDVSTPGTDKPPVFPIPSTTGFAPRDRSQSTPVRVSLGGSVTGTPDTGSRAAAVPVRITATPTSVTSTPGAVNTPTSSTPLSTANRGGGGSGPLSGTPPAQTSLLTTQMQQHQPPGSASSMNAPAGTGSDGLSQLGRLSPMHFPGLKGGQGAPALSSTPPTSLLHSMGASPPTTQGSLEHSTSLPTQSPLGHFVRRPSSGDFPGIAPFKGAAGTPPTTGSLSNVPTPPAGGGGGRRESPRPGSRSVLTAADRTESLAVPITSTPTSTSGGGTPGSSAIQTGTSAPRAIPPRSHHSSRESPRPRRQSGDSIGSGSYGSYGSYGPPIAMFDAAMAATIGAFVDQPESGAGVSIPSSAGASVELSGAQEESREKAISEFAQQCANAPPLKAFSRSKPPIAPSPPHQQQQQHTRQPQQQQQQQQSQQLSSSPTPIVGFASGQTATPPSHGPQGPAAASAPPARTLGDFDKKLARFHASRDRWRHDMASKSRTGASSTGAPVDDSATLSNIKRVTSIDEGMNVLLPAQGGDAAGKSQVEGGMDNGTPADDTGTS